MTILLLKGYNNYFNRIRKQEADITTYKTKSTSYLEYADVNFNPNDGIVAELIVGGPTQKIVTTVGTETVSKILDFEDAGSPDYLIAHENNVIKSRWFVLECVRVRAGQYRLALKRDVLVDFNETIMNSPCFVEKGWIENVDNPLVLNAEGFQGNQQKQSEKLLRDATNCAWLVGYLKKDMSQAESFTYTFPAAVPDLPNLDSFSWSDCVTLYNLDGSITSALKQAAMFDANKSTMKLRVWYPSAKTLGWVNPKNIRETIYLSGGNYNASVDQANVDWAGLTSSALDLEEHDLAAVSIGIAESEARQLAKEIYEHTFQWSYVNGFFNTLVNATKYTVTSGNNLVDPAEDLSIYNNKLVIKNNKVYRLSVGQGTEKTYDTYYTGNDGVCNDYLSSLYYEFMYHRYLYRNQDNPSKKKVRITLNYREYTITATEVVVGETISYTLPTSANRNTCGDALYDIFCMPISPKAIGLNVAETDTVIIDSNSDTSTGAGCLFLDLNSEYQLAMAAQIATKLGAGGNAGNIYDLQLLPYCPMIDELNPYYQNTYYNVTYGKNVIDLTNLTSKDYAIFYNGDSKACGIIFYPKKANFALGIEYSEVNETVHDEWITIEKPVMKAQGTHDGLPQYRFAAFPYKVTDGTWDIGPNANNPDAEDLILENGLTLEDCEYISLSVSGGLQSPQLYLTSTEFPTPPAGQENSYTFVGDFTIKVRAHWIIPDDSLDRKIKNECDFYRLTSPNYNSFYEFKKTKLAGGINGLRAVCTYKPFTPYIKINPNLNDSLYSKVDYNDNIGLMLAGDYSLPMLSDAMINYELQNRNYQAIFNRELQSLDVSQQIAKEQQQFTGLVGAITAPITGGVAGALAGAKAGPYGAIAGAAVGAVGGGILGGVGYQKDMEWLEKQQYEARDFAVDKFNHQLGNVKALPQTMTKSTPLAYNNKVWPILEYFSCTEEEKNVLRNKLKYDGMTIMAVGVLNDYSVNGGYLKGKMIRLLDLKDDSHIAQAIYEEVVKGFYEGE